MTFIFNVQGKNTITCTVVVVQVVVVKKHTPTTIKTKYQYYRTGKGVGTSACIHSVINLPQGSNKVLMTSTSQSQSHEQLQIRRLAKCTLGVHIVFLVYTFKLSWKWAR